LSSRDIKKEEEALTLFAHPILNKPKPAPKVEEPATADADTPMDDSSENKKKDDMDID
jgi:heat shock protein 4